MPSMSFQSMLSSVSSKLGNSRLNSENIGMLFAAMICILAPLELSQLAFALIGALAYAALQAFSPRPPKTNCQLAAEREQRERERVRGWPRTLAKRPAPVKGSAGQPSVSAFPWQRRARPVANSRGPPPPAAAEVKPDVYQPSQVPVFAPKFESIGWEAEVNELVSQLSPGVDEDQAVQRLVLHVKHTMQALFATVEVSGFAHGSLKCGKAFGVAVPEVDIVANVSPAVLAQRLQPRSQRLDMKKLQKSAIRTCTDRLVSEAGLKFRRSAFRGEEPRVTLLVPSNLGFFADAIPVDFSINTVTPFYTAALLTECGQFEPRAKALILLVKRWAKDRGICHAAKGHLYPYLWSLLVMYFMQVGVEDEGALLPVLEAFKISSHLATSSALNPSSKASSAPSTTSSIENAAKLSIAQLFYKFVQFYSQRFNWRNEAISICSGRRAPPAVSLPLHVILSEDGSTIVGPTIQDPFNPTNNLGACMNKVSLSRLHEELNRACKLCARGASLTEMLEPWVPPEEKQERSGGSSHGE